MLHYIQERVIRVTRKAVAHQVVNKTLSVAGTPEVLIAIDRARMAEANKFSLITDCDVFVAINGDSLAPEDALEIRAGEGYSDDDITITDKLTFINKNPGERPHVRGILWGN